MLIENEPFAGKFLEQLPYLEKHIVRSLEYADKDEIFSTLRVLLDNKYDISFIPLDTLAKQVNKEDIQLFLDSRADINKADPNGNTLLHISAESGHQEIVESLQKVGAEYIQEEFGL